MVKDSPKGYYPPQGLEIGEQLLWKYENTTTSLSTHDPKFYSPQYKNYKHSSNITSLLIQFLN